MAVAQLVGNQCFELGLVGGHHRLGEIVDGFFDRGLVRRFGMGRQGRDGERKGAGGGEMTTGDTHLGSLPRSIVMVMAAEDQRFRPLGEPTPG
jgi:hypothetical protein